jgi:hypothetical protein
MEGLLPSAVLSLLASAAATYLLRQLLSAASPPGHEDQAGDGARYPASNVNVTVPVVVIVAGNRYLRGRRGPPAAVLPLLLARALRARRRSTAPQPPWRRRLR